MFIDLIHSRKDPTDTQKLHYHHSSLRDEHLNIIKNLHISTENYKVTLELLKERYDNKLIISVYNIQNILNDNTKYSASVKNIST